MKPVPDLLAWAAFFIALLSAPLAGWLICDPLICKHLFRRFRIGKCESHSIRNLDTIYEASDEDEWETTNHAAHHDSSAAKQQAAALHEARIMNASMHCDVPSTVNGDAMDALVNKGFVRFNGIVGKKIIIMTIII